MERVLLGLILVSVTVPPTASECHCNTTDACAVFPSTPCSQVGSPDRCQEAWFGQYCEKHNIAFGRPAIQSSVYTEKSSKTNGTYYYFTADHAVDGGTSTSFYEKPFTCARTGDTRPNFWNLSLNALTTDKIYHLRLYIPSVGNRGIQILVGSEMCYRWQNSDEAPAVADVTCSQPLAVNNITIRSPGYYYFSLCEVQVFVCGDGWFGAECDKQCNCLRITEVCDKITGQCHQSGCSSGYTGTACQTACPDGRYGVKCASQCGHCLDTDVCDKGTGKCPRGCQPGWWPDVCSQACSDGRYGHHCQSECGQCKENLPCNKINGICDQGCQPGFQKPSCKECVDGMYGDDCMSQCGRCKDALICDKSSGECPEGCQGYFMKPLCQECPATPGYLSREAPVVATLGTLLVLAVIALLTSIFYIRRLKRQLAASQKKPEDNYISLDENTKDPHMETTYQDIDSTAPLANTEEDQQVRI